MIVSNAAVDEMGSVPHTGLAMTSATCHRHTYLTVATCHTDDDRHVSQAQVPLAGHGAVRGRRRAVRQLIIYK